MTGHHTTTPATVGPLTTCHGHPCPTGPPNPPASPSAAKPASQPTTKPPASASPSPRGTDRRHALDQLTRRNTTALDSLKSYGDTVEKLETGAFVITPRKRWNDKGRGERIRAHHGHVRIAATLNDSTALGELTTRLADLELTAGDGPYRALRTDSPDHRRARQQAVTEAVQRAREYAAALDTRLIASSNSPTPAPRTPHHPSHPPPAACTPATAAPPPNPHRPPTSNHGARPSTPTSTPASPSHPPTL
ncbi:SIMPL domain-containing protein [Streptomyces meridianus]|uniref:SIMPL domain-containing protein n=1 Tax=Streptomyces meridianus TaxID=2938945 RepID=UPI00355695B9